MRVRIHVVDRRRDEEAAGHGGVSIAAAAPTPARILATVAAVAARLESAGIEWHLAGSAGRLLLGADARPADVDVEVHAADGPRAAAALGLPPPLREEDEHWTSWRSQGVLAHACIDMSAGLEVRGDPAHVGGPGITLAAMDAASVGIRLGHSTVHVIAPGEALARAMVAGDTGRLTRARMSLPLDGDARLAALAYCEARRRHAGISR